MRGKPQQIRYPQKAGYPLNKNFRVPFLLSRVNCMGGIPPLRYAPRRPPIPPRTAKRNFYQALNNYIECLPSANRVRALLLFFPSHFV